MAERAHSVMDLQQMLPYPDAGNYFQTSSLEKGLKQFSCQFDSKKEEEKKKYLLFKEIQYPFFRI